MDSEKARDALSRRAFVGCLAVGGATLLGAGEPVVSSTSPLAFAAPPAGGSEERARSRPAFVEPYSVPCVVPLEDRAAKSKRVLVVVDYQVDFVSGGVFGTIEPAVAIEDALCATVQQYLESGDVVMYTMDTHPADDYQNTREAMVNPLHCDPETEGWQLYGKLRDLIGPHNATMIKKGTYGAKGLPAAVQSLRDQGVAIQSIELAGVSTTCRVLHNAILLYNFFPELPIIFDENTTASYTEERTQEQLYELESWGFVVRR